MELTAQIKSEYISPVGDIVFSAEKRKMEGLGKKLEKNHGTHH
jgi:hypothetical protein